MRHRAQACVSAAAADAAESGGTLRYAHRARNIENCAVLNIDPQTQLLRRLRVERNVFLRDAVRFKVCGTAAIVLS